MDRMVEQNRSGAHTQIVYAATGEKFALMSGQTLQKAFVPLPGGGVATYNGSGLLYYGHSDHLGSFRVGSTTTRTVSFDLAYAPFGETYALLNSPDISFTGQRQDTSTGLYDSLAREYSNQGRWSTPDPAGLAAVDLSNPQSWNRYAYVLNNPLRLTDPTGLYCEFYGHNFGDETDVEEIDDQIDEPGCGAAGGGWFEPVTTVTVNGDDPSDGGIFSGFGIDGGGGNTSGGGSIFQRIKNAVCSALPTGRSTSAGIAAGGVGSVGGSLDTFVNYNSGQTSVFATGGGGLGWNGGGSLAATTGLIYGLDGTNNGFSHSFTGGNLYVLLLSPERASVVQ
jgi:RHS repeat-associated protein